MSGDATYPDLRNRQGASLILSLTLDYTQGCRLEVPMLRLGKSMQIGQVSKQTGMSIDAIRFYERSRLLAAPIRSAGGFRLYSSDDVAALKFIRTLQTLGFSLNEVRDFVSLRTNDLRACSAVRKMLDHKLKDIHAKRIALAKLEDELKIALTRCNSRLTRSRRNTSARCPVLTTFGQFKHKGGE
jgi:MerR family transcriptional regulator, copper efflux regulator